MIVKNDMKKVTLLIPVYNEEAMLPTLYQRLIELVNRNAVYEWEILFVNDGSSDTTLECLRRLRQQDKRVNYVNLSRNFGKEVAMLAGFDYATGDCCVVLSVFIKAVLALQHPKRHVLMVIDHLAFSNPFKCWHGYPPYCRQELHLWFQREKELFLALCEARQVNHFSVSIRLRYSIRQMIQLADRPDNLQSEQMPSLCF